MRITNYKGYYGGFSRGTSNNYLYYFGASLLER